MLDQQNNAIELTKTMVKLGPNDLGPAAEFSSPATGGGSGSPAPPGISVLIRKQSAAGGRANRGRLFMPGIADEDMVAGGALASGIQAAFQGAADDLWGAMVAAELSPVVLHAANSPVTTPTPIVSLSVDAVVATQRRRQRR
jgi:hypothetical protein